MIPEAARACVERHPLSFVATINADGSPHLSPKGTIRVRDTDTLVFADIASPAPLPTSGATAVSRSAGRAARNYRYRKHDMRYVFPRSWCTARPDGGSRSWH